MRRVAVTGIGAVTALGVDADASFAELIEGRSGIRRLTLFETKGYRTNLAAEAVSPDDGLDLAASDYRRTSRCDRLALRAAMEAAASSGLAGAAVEEGALVFGAGASGLFEAEDYYREWLERGPRRASVSKTIGYYPNTATDLVGRILGIRGFRSTIVTACSSSAIAIGRAAAIVRRGEAEVAFCGGADALSRLTYSGFDSLRATDRFPCRPFDAERNGLTLGEGAAVFVLEPLQAAKDRGARIYAEFLGCGIRCDAHHMTSPDPTGEGAARTMRAALEDARLDAADVDYVNAHGTATRMNDAVETKALKALFLGHAREVWVSSIKGAVGHCLGAAGAVEALATVLAIDRGVVPPTLGLDHPDPECDLDYVPNHAREGAIRIAMTNSFAFGGNNAALIFGRVA